MSDRPIMWRSWPQIARSRKLIIFEGVPTRTPCARNEWRQAQFTMSVESADSLLLLEATDKNGSFDHSMGTLWVTDTVS